ncbi:hypothetical protein QOT17_014753 [Balamuthia mandrillaris]
MEGYPTKEVMPGVYLTDFREHTQREGAEDGSGEGGATVNLMAVQLRIKELQHSVTHLKRSNRELGEALLEERDPVLEEAIQENLQVIAKREQLILDLQACLPEHALQDDTPTTNASAASNPEDDGMYI